MQVARSWSARATREGAKAYADFFRSTLAPQLDRIDGHCGALVLEHALDDHIEITVLTLWDSIEAVRRFAGDAFERAVVEPEARAVLLSFDEYVEHRILMFDTRAATI